MFSRIDHILGHKTSLNKFKRIEIVCSILSDHNSMKPEINHRKKNRKRMNTWRLNNMLLRNKQVNNEIKEEIRKCLKTSENENTTLQNLWDAAKADLRGTFTVNQAFLKIQEKSQINNLTNHIKEFEKEEQTKPKVIRRKEIIKIRKEINRDQENNRGTSLVAQWLRICLPVQGHGFDPWSRKIPHAAEQLSPCATTTEACVTYSLHATTTEPTCCNY